MFIVNQSLKFLSISLCLLLVSCAELPFARTQITTKTPEEKLTAAQSAVDAHPNQPAYRSALLNQHENTARELLLSAEQSRAAGKWDEAVLYYIRVMQVDKANVKARNALKEIETERRHLRLVEDARKHVENGEVDNANVKLRNVLLENPLQKEALILKAEMQNRDNALPKKPIKLNSNLTKLINLEFRDANIKLVFEALSRNTGINFVLDKDIKPDAKTTVYLKNTTLDQALTVIFASNQLQKKYISENTILIYPDTPQKARSYQELVIKSFYLVNADVKQTASLLRSMLKVRDIHMDERLNLLVLRDTAENIRLAEKLVTLQDTAEPEVMLEVEVLEITRGRLSNLGIQFPNQATVGMLGVDGNLTALTVEALRSLNGNNILLSPNPALNFKKDESVIDLLANPRIRVKNREKARVQIGDRVPIITSNVTGTAATVSETVQYIDVGLKLEVQPVVSLDEYVSIKVGLEVSSLGQQTLTNTGSVVYQIGTRNANTLLRLKDGETQILAGLINESERKDVSKIPALGDLPLIGRLFGSQRSDKTKTEIVLAITPHIINNIRRPSADLLEFWSGTEAVASMGNASAASTPDNLTANNLTPDNLTPDNLTPDNAVTDNTLNDNNISATQNSLELNNAAMPSAIDSRPTAPSDAGNQAPMSVNSISASPTNTNEANTAETGAIEFDR